MNLIYIFQIYIALWDILKIILQIKNSKHRLMISLGYAAGLRVGEVINLKIGDVDLEELPKLNETEIRKQLTSIKGIGDWTTDIYLMFCLQSKDIFPIGDIAVVNTVKELSDAKTKEEIILLAEKWKPFRSLAVYFLWHYYLNKRNRQIQC